MIHADPSKHHNGDMPTGLLVVSDREPLAWLLHQERFAIPESRATSGPAPGTTLLIYTTRGCYRNPTRDRGLVMGIATVTSDLARLEHPMTFRGRHYAAGFHLELNGVAPPHRGVDLGALAGSLEALPDRATWSARLRRSVVPLTDRDAQIITQSLTPLLRPIAEQLPEYDDACKTGTRPEYRHGAI